MTNFPNLCRFIAHTIGEPNRELALKAYVGCWMPYDTPCLCYVDDQIEIVAATNSLAVHAVRKENNNPVLAVDETGKTFRFHGEIHYIYEHLHLLLERASASVRMDLDKYIENRRKWDEKRSGSSDTAGANSSKSEAISS